MEMTTLAPEINQQALTKPKFFIFRHWVLCPFFIFFRDFVDLHGSRMSDDDWLTDRTAAGSQSTSNADGGTQKVVAPPKLLLRPKPEETSTNSEKVEKPAPKTLKQKEAEYAAARARIFGYSANGGTGRGRGRASQGRGQSRAQQNNTSERKPRVDAHDPDYDRNPHRYAPRLVPGNESHGPSSRYIPPTYETEFPSL